MKIEEVVGILESGRNICKMTAVGHSLSWVLTDYGREALTIAIGLLKKQIPQEPISEHCPSCKQDVRNWTGDNEFDYCPSCGQALSWGEKKELS